MNRMKLFGTRWYMDIQGLRWYWNETLGAYSRQGYAAGRLISQSIRTDCGNGYPYELRVTDITEDPGHTSEFRRFKTLPEAKRAAVRWTKEITAS